MNLSLTNQEATSAIHISSLPGGKKMSLTAFLEHLNILSNAFVESKEDDMHQRPNTHTHALSLCDTMCEVF